MHLPYSPKLKDEVQSRPSHVSSHRLHSIQRVHGKSFPVWVREDFLVGSSASPRRDPSQSQEASKVHFPGQEHEDAVSHMGTIGGSSHPGALSEDFGSGGATGGSMHGAMSEDIA